MLDFIKKLLQTKDGSWNLKKIMAVTFFLVILISWIAAQFFHREIPEFIFNAFVRLLESIFQE